VLGQTFRHVMVQQVYRSSVRLTRLAETSSLLASADLVSEDPASPAVALPACRVPGVAYESLPFALREHLHTQVGDVARSEQRRADGH